MKKILFLAVIIAFSFTGYAQNKNAKANVEVDGVCMMCKLRIEKAAVRTKGVKSAVWSMETHQLSLIYDERKTDLETIQQNVAKVGHDTPVAKATDEAYNSVDPCCKYRDPKVVDDHKKGDGH